LIRPQFIETPSRGPSTDGHGDDNKRTDHEVYDYALHAANIGIGPGESIAQNRIAALSRKVRGGTRPSTRP